MKVLAISKEIPPVDWDAQEEILADEADVLHQLYLDDHVREFYYTGTGEAVLMLECRSLKESMELLQQLPLVRKGLIGFSVMELLPYSGFTRLFNHGNK
jgi:hypothetical protein